MARFLLIGVVIGIVIALLFRRGRRPTPMVEEIHPVKSGDESRGVLPAGDETRTGQRDASSQRRDP